MKRELRLYIDKRHGAPDGLAQNNPQLSNIYKQTPKETLTTHTKRLHYFQIQLASHGLSRSLVTQPKSVLYFFSVLEIKVNVRRLLITNTVCYYLLPYYV